MGLLLLLACAVSFPARAGDSAPESRPPDLPNLCAEDATFAGGLGKDMAGRLPTSRQPLRRIHLPPQDLIVRWARPVTFNTHTIGWESAEVRGLHYGLEYWDAGQQRFVLLYEQKANQQAARLHAFPSVTTSEVRFTVFDHVLRYDAIVITQFGLYARP